jgi:hypothetical protein
MWSISGGKLAFAARGGCLRQDAYWSPIRTSAAIAVSFRSHCFEPVGETVRQRAFQTAGNRRWDERIPLITKKRTPLRSQFKVTVSSPRVELWNNQPHAQPECDRGAPASSAIWPASWLQFGDLVPEVPTSAEPIPLQWPTRGELLELWPPSRAVTRPIAALERGALIACCSPTGRLSHLP